MYAIVIVDWIAFVSLSAAIAHHRSICSKLVDSFVHALAIHCYCWFAAVARSRCVCVYACPMHPFEYIGRARVRANSSTKHRSAMKIDTNEIEWSTHRHKRTRPHSLTFACVHMLAFILCDYVRLGLIVYVRVCMDVQFGQTNITVTAHFASSVKNSR